MLGTFSFLLALSSLYCVIVHKKKKKFILCDKHNTLDENLRRPPKKENHYKIRRISKIKKRKEKK